MGMFDSLYDEHGNDWQTKAYHCGLEAFRVGDSMPEVGASTYQVRLLGEIDGAFVHSLATVRDNVLVSINDSRDDRLSQLDYHGGFWTEDTSEVV